MRDTCTDCLGVVPVQQRKIITNYIEFHCHKQRAVVVGMLVSYVVAGGCRCNVVGGNFRLQFQNQTTVCGLKGLIRGWNYDSRAKSYPSIQCNPLNSSEPAIPGQIAECYNKIKYRVLLAIVTQFKPMFVVLFNLATVGGSVWQVTRVNRLVLKSNSIVSSVCVVNHHDIMILDLSRLFDRTMGPCHLLVARNW